MRWVILNPLATPAEVFRRIQALPLVAACVTIESCEQAARAVMSLSDGVILFLDRNYDTDKSHTTSHSSSLFNTIPHRHIGNRPVIPPSLQPRSIHDDEVLPNYFTLTSGSSGLPQSVRCSGKSLWARLLVQLSPSVPLKGLVPPHLRTLDRKYLDWREFMNLCAKSSDEGAFESSVCVWKTAIEFCDTVVEMLLGVTYGVTQVIFCCDGALSFQCSSIAAALCGRKRVTQYLPDLRPIRFDVQRLFRVLHLYQVSHMTAVPSLIASLLALEEYCCPLLHSVVGAQLAANDATGHDCGCMFQSLRVIASSGEALHCSLVERLRTLLLRHAQANLSLINVYGCAETTADASCFELKLPGERCSDALGAFAPLGEALPGSRIGVLMSGATGIPQECQCPVSLDAAGTCADVSCASFRICWLHDAASPAGIGRIVVGGVCVAKGYAQRMDNAVPVDALELSPELLSKPSKSFFAWVHDENRSENVPVFVTMDNAEIVAEKEGKRWLLYRGRHDPSISKIRGVFVSLENIESVVQGVDMLRFIVTAEGSEWDCCSRVSVSRAAFIDDALTVVVAFDFVVELLRCSVHLIKSVSRFSSRRALHQFLCLFVQSVLKRQLHPESVPVLHKMFAYCTNIFFVETPPTETIDCCAEVLLSRAPLLPSGKLDFSAACSSRDDLAVVECDNANGELALAIASCVRQVLATEAQVHVDANFFDLGIDSLSGTRLLIAVRALSMHCHRHMPFEALLQNPSANALATALSSSSLRMKLLTTPSLVSHNQGVVTNEPLAEQSAASALSSCQSSDFSRFSTQDEVETRVIEWLPNASVRLWKKQNQDWECRVTCMTSVTLPVWGSFYGHCKRLEQVKWKIDMSACVDASPLIFALRASEFGLQCKASDEVFPIWPGFSVIAIVGSHAGLVVAAAVETGEVLWSVTLPDRVEPGASSAVLHPHSASVLMGCYDGYLYALCICNGIVKWRFDTNDASIMMRVAPSERDYSSSKRSKVAGKETMLNPDREPVKGGVCLIDCSCCIACSAWSKCGGLIGVAGYSKRFFAIQTVGDGAIKESFSCEVAGSVVAPLLSCRCCCSGSKSRVVAAATSGFLTCFLIINGQRVAEEWSINLGGPLFSSPACFVSSPSSSVVVASATGQLFLVSALGQLQQRLQPLESPSSFMSAPRVVFSKESRVALLLSSTGNAGVLVFDCNSSGVHLIARLMVDCARGRASFMSSPCIYRVDPLKNNIAFVAIVCASDGVLYAAAVDCDQLESSHPVFMSEIFDAKCGVFCSPSVVPLLFRDSTEAPPRGDVRMLPPYCMSLAVILGGRDNNMRCLQ
jgi:acyl-CoA synthetase (AMP-forming)/AMP-acid ligase II